MQETKKNGRKRWFLRDQRTPEAKAAAEEIASALGLHPVVARLLVNRGYRDTESARRFLSMESELLCNPFDLTDVVKAVDRIEEAVKNGERITIYGDYDVDGVTSVCTLYLYLKSKGADVSYYIPNRTGEGYGVSVGAIRNLAEAGTRLIITVDTGITANEEVAFANSLGVDVVITDHHECRPELPHAVAVVNPHRHDCAYPFKELAGVGVVFKLICAYEERTTGEGRLRSVSRLCKEYADLVAIGTIADVMPIQGENRLIVGYGLRLMEKSRRPGFSALIAAASQRTDGSSRTKSEVKITSGYIGYTIAPRLNAAGRIRSATLAVELFLSESAEKGMTIARELCEANRERQAEENRIMKEAYRKIEAEHDFENDSVIVLDADNWHHGVIGIVASRITEKYGLPSILVSFENGEESPKGEEDVGKGSGRSIKGMNLVEALVHCSDCLVKHGGHELAAGLSVKRGKLAEFRRKINEYARQNLSKEAMVATMEGDCELTPSDITMDLAQALQLLEPYGVSNPLPVFVMYGVTVEECMAISAGKHTRFTLGDGVRHFCAMYFSQNAAQLGLYVGDRIDVMFTLDINEWAGRRSVQLIVKDIRLCVEEANRAERDRARFDEIFAGAPIRGDEDVVPTRDDFAAVYTYIKQTVRAGESQIAHRAILAYMKRMGVNVGYIKLKFIIRVFQELNLLGIEEYSEEEYRFCLVFSPGKTDLEKSNILRRLRMQKQN